MASRDGTNGQRLKGKDDEHPGMELRAICFQVPAAPPTFAQFTAGGDMARIERFEDLIAWQKARILSREIYRATRASAFSQDYRLAQQIRGAATSIMSNIAEGFERGSRSEFHQFLVIAKGSCAEVRAQLYVAVDAEHIGEGQFRKLYELSTEVGRIIGGLKESVKKQRDGVDKRTKSKGKGER
jgi:four helix bundle protein